jgi:C4-dicarboxylate-specific signal transduction histidine kinase
LPKRFSNGLSTTEPSIFYQRPWLGGRWGVREAIDYMLTADFAIMAFASVHSEALLQKAYDLARTSIAMGKNGTPFAYVLPEQQWDFYAAREMLQRVQADFAHAARMSMLGELTASIAHEVNQPLAAIAINGEVALRLLNRSEPDLADVRELAKSVVADARRAADVIARVRTMATRQAPEQTLLSVDEVIGEALQFLRHEVQSHGLTVTHHSNPAAPKMLGDRTQLQQVFVNLMVNAIQAMAQMGATGRTLVVRTTLSDPSTLCCTLEDSGPGIKPEHLDHLFDSFFTTKDGGIGLGLPISRSIIEAHGGHIRADNESVYGGARFSCTFPAKPQ